jgi:hypothetical protein
MHLALAEDDLDPAIHLYRDAFAELNTRTVQNHMMSIAKLEALFADKRFRKYTSWDASGDLAGLSCITNDLEAQTEMTDISLPFFEHHWPDLFAEQRIWYIGFVCARPDAPRETFPDLVAAMMDPIRASRGVGVLDYSADVMNVRHLHRTSELVIRRLAPLRAAVEIGSQHYFAYDFNWPEV